MLGKAVFLKVRGIQCRADAGSSATHGKCILAGTIPKTNVRLRDRTVLQSTDLEPVERIA